MGIAVRAPRRVKTQVMYLVNHGFGGFGCSGPGAWALIKDGCYMSSVDGLQDGGARFQHGSWYLSHKSSFLITWIYTSFKFRFQDNDYSPSLILVEFLEVNTLKTDDFNQLISNPESHNLMIM